METNFNIYSTILASLQTLCQGYIPAAILGIGLGMIVSSNSVLYHILKRCLQIPASIPAIALLPIALIRFQSNQITLVSIIFFSAIWQIAIHTATGVIKSRREEKGSIVAIEHIFTGLRMGMILAWFTAIAGELLLGSKGIGFFVWDAYQTNETEKVFQGVFYIAIIGFLLDSLLELAGYLVSRPFANNQKDQS